jgi:hypothetical protein
MTGMLLASCLLLGAAGDASSIYHYRDGQGVDHYVNHAEQVPAGVSADRLKLTEDLNPDLAKQMAESAQRAAAETKAQAAEEVRLRASEGGKAGLAKGIPAQPEAVALPAEARLVLIWSIAFTIVFIVLWSTRGLLLRHSPPLAVAFQPLRWGTGVAALVSWIFLLVLARGWIGDHFPPLRDVARAKANIDKINRQQRAAEHELDKSLNGK